MKRIIILLFTTLIGTWAAAQVKDSVKMLEPVTVTPTSNVNQEVTKSFNKSFKSATHAKWYEMNKDYLVKFIQNDMSHSAYFKQNGKMVYHISYGYESNLTPEMKQIVQGSYPDYKISRAINVKSQGRDIWVVNLEGTSRWIMVGIEEGKLEELKNFQKG